MTINTVRAAGCCGSLSNKAAEGVQSAGRFAKTAGNACGDGFRKVANYISNGWSKLVAHATYACQVIKGYFVTGYVAARSYIANNPVQVRNMTIGAVLAAVLGVIFCRYCYNKEETKTDASLATTTTKPDGTTTTTTATGSTTGPTNADIKLNTEDTNVDTSTLANPAPMSTTTNPADKPADSLKKD